MEENFNPPFDPAQGKQIKRNTPRDVFLHLFAMVTLYWSAISVITLCWQYINYFFPDVLNYNYGFSSSMRFALASLFIVFPLFLLVSWILNKIYSKESMVRESKVRKWLIYLTLFVTALVILGDLVFTVNTFLNGDLTSRFILKALSVLIVAGVIFWHYLQDIRSNAPVTSAKYVVIVASALILVMVIGAFFIVGSPMTARSLQFDQQRTYDLQNIQYQVVNYWQRKQVLPQNLSELTDSISGYTVPIDPQTNMPYEYMVKDATALNFQLCATFALASESLPAGRQAKTPVPAMYYEGAPENWNHSAGRVCFDRVIDKQLYPPFPAGK